MRGSGVRRPWAQQVTALQGALAAHGATTGILVATGVFADEAVQQAQALNIELLGGEDFLRHAPNAPSVTVIEPDPTYELASTPRATGGARHQRRTQHSR